MKKEEIRAFNVELDGRYGQLALSWDETEGADGYLVTVQGKTADGYRDLYGVTVDGNYYRASDLLAYGLQQQGPHEKARLVVYGLEENRKISRGVTADFLTENYYPEKAELIIGQDLSLEAITSISFHSSGMSAESNFSYVAMKEDEEAILYYGDDQERKLTGNHWQQLLALVSRGRILRRPVRDPQLIVLDESSCGYRLSWEGIRECEESYYQLLMPDDELLKTMETLSRSSHFLAGFPVNWPGKRKK